MSVDVERKRRRWPVWAGIAVLLVLGFILAVAASLNSGPYSFLDQFHPERVEVDESTIYGPGGKPRGVTTPKITMLVFRLGDHDRILAAMKKELTPARGFDSHQLSVGPGGGLWEFPEKSASSAKSILAPEGAFYLYGEVAGSVENNFRSPRRPPSALRQACVVVIFRDETWVEAQWARVKGFLHLG